ncbi:MAG: hypothetical protein IJI35_13365, partial [Kiritimatiellae bacterium]|nr:hypothetical protein [Kiritimatiellia bacterium]
GVGFFQARRSGRSAASFSNALTLRIPFSPAVRWPYLATHALGFLWYNYLNPLDELSEELMP